MVQITMEMLPPVRERGRQQQRQQQQQPYLENRAHVNHTVQNSTLDPAGGGDMGKDSWRWNFLHHFLILETAVGGNQGKQGSL
jgi:hypothetical protein